MRWTPLLAWTAALAQVACLFALCAATAATMPPPTTTPPIDSPTTRPVCDLRGGSVGGGRNPGIGGAPGTKLGCEPGRGYACGVGCDANCGVPLGIARFGCEPSRCDGVPAGTPGVCIGVGLYVPGMDARTGCVGASAGGVVRATTSNARSTSPIVCGRSSGFFASMRATSASSGGGVVGTTERRPGGISFMCFWHASAIVWA